MDTDKTLSEAAFDVMKEHLLMVKEQYGTETAKAIINTIGLAPRMHEIPEEHFNAVTVACKVKLGLSGKEETEPLDVLDEPAWALGDEGMQAAIDVINGIPEGERTVEAALKAVWRVWVELGAFPDR